MTLPPARLSRFARHIVLPEVGGAGQVALAGAHLALIGCGGIGSPALQYLSAAGIGRLTLIDDDLVEESNLQRQTIFNPADIGHAKAEAAAAWVSRFDPAISVRAIVARIDQGLTGTAYLILSYTAAGPSDWTDREWQSTLHRQLSGQAVKILPARISGGGPPAILADIKYADLVADWAAGVQGLLRAIR